MDKADSGSGHNWIPLSTAHLPMISRPSTGSILHPPLNTNYLGRCLLFNYIEHDTVTTSTAQVAQTNITYLSVLFGALGFKVIQHQHLTAADTLEILKQESQLNHSHYNYLVIYIIAPCSFQIKKKGTTIQEFTCREDEHSKDEDEVKFETVFDYFTDERCTTLARKPKLVFIQHLGSPVNIKLERLRIDLPMHFLLFLTLNNVTYPTVPEHSFAVQRLYFFLRRFVDLHPLVPILEKVLVHLNYTEQTTILLSKVPSDIFFNEQISENYLALGRHFKSLKSGGGSDSKRLLLIDYQNIESAKLSRIEQNFSHLGFTCSFFSQLTLAQIRSLLRHESRVLKYEGASTCSTVVFTIFAKLNNQGFLTSSGDRFGVREALYWLTEDEDDINFRVETRPICTGPKSTKMYFLVNDYRKEEEEKEVDSRAPFGFTTVHSNVLIAFNSNARENVLQVGGKESLKLPKEILKLSRNSVMQYVDSGNTESKQIVTKGKVIILDFNLLECHQLERQKNVAEDVSLLEGTFAQLGFSVESLKDCTWKQLVSLMERESSLDYQSDECLILCFVTHFENGWFHCADQQVHLKSLLHQLHKSSPALAALPKILLMYNVYEDLTQRQLTADHRPYTYDRYHFMLPDQLAIPPNFLLIHSSTSSSITESTPRFLPVFCQLLQENIAQYDLQSVLCLVAQSMHDHHHQNMYIKDSLKRPISFSLDPPPTSPCTDGLLPPTITRLFPSIVNHISHFLWEKILTRGEGLFYRQTKGKCLLIRSVTLLKNEADIVDRLKMQLSGMAFDVVQIDWRAHVRLEEILKFESQQNFDNYDSLLVFVFPGQQHSETALQRESLANHFSQPDSLHGKPKLFLLPDQLFTISIDADDLGLSTLPVIRIPTFADFLLFYTTQIFSIADHLVSLLRDPTSASLDLVTILSKLTATTSAANVPYLNSTLTKLFSLRPSDNLSAMHLDPCPSLPTTNRGICYLFNYKTCTNRSEREGTGTDVNSLVSTFRLLNYSIVPFNDLTARETLYELDVISKTDHSHHQSVVICYLSHGSQGGVLLCKEGQIRRANLINALARNATLAGKPKLIFIQACQGELVDEGVCLIAETDSTEECIIPEVSRQPNFFIFSSTYPGYVSYRDRRLGSWFIQALCRVLELHRNEFDLAAIAAKVSRLVAYKRQEYRQKQIPFLYSTLVQPIRLADEGSA